MTRDDGGTFVLISESQSGLGLEESWTVLCAVLTPPTPAPTPERPICTGFGQICAVVSSAWGQ